MRHKFFLVLLGMISLASTGFRAAADDFLNDFNERSDEANVKFMEEHPDLIEHKFDLECTPLHCAVVRGKPKTVKWLLEHKADANTVAYNKFTPMHVVSDGAIAELLIKAGANLYAIDIWGETPLQEAAFMSNSVKSSGYKGVCDSILASGYPMDLLSALWMGKQEVAIKIIKDNPIAATKVDVTTDLWGNKSPLGVAAQRGYVEIVNLLLQVGAPVNDMTLRPNGRPMTPLANAVGAGHYEVAKALCEAGADCNMVVGNSGETLLDYAMKNSEKRMIDLLTQHGAKPARKGGGKQFLSE